MELIKQISAIFIGLSSGLVISGAVFAFISVVGIVPRLAQKTGTKNRIRLYETALTLGGLLGTAVGLFDARLPITSAGAVIYSFCVGVFYGCLAVSLAEVINVIPILTRRTKIARGMFFFILAIALGKLAGSLMYYGISGFYKPE
ncbi:MAG: stage V sporulation protein AB [Defluviitaleaceae bacterium]|nr:stage V sporulation protein AB [Defluviitaleaceae bacterium]